MENHDESSVSNKWACCMLSKSHLAVPPIQGVIYYRHRQKLFSPRTDRCCFPWMGMLCKSSGQACIRRDSRGCSLPSKNIQDWSRVDTFKLSYHDKSCPPEVTNWAGKAASFAICAICTVTHLQSPYRRHVLEPFLLKRTTQLDQSLYLLWDWCFDPTLAEESSMCAGRGCILSLLETDDLDYRLQQIFKRSHPYCNLVRVTR